MVAETSLNEDEKSIDAEVFTCLLKSIELLAHDHDNLMLFRREALPNVFSLMPNDGLRIQLLDFLLVQKFIFLV